MGFCFLDLASNYEPPAELVEWLEAGDKPIYIGFGSLVSLSFPLFLQTNGIDVMMCSISRVSTDCVFIYGCDINYLMRNRK